MPNIILTAHTQAELRTAFIQMEELRKQGKWLAGYVSYEAGFALENKLVQLLPPANNTPLLVMGVFDTVEISTTQNAHFASVPTNPLLNSRPSLSHSEYINMLTKAREYIAQGDCYQLNLTFPIMAEWQEDPIQLFHILAARQPVAHSALVNLNQTMILSRSPELFFKIDANGIIETRPMKGTIKRGNSTQDDIKNYTFLKTDQKNQAENRMIVDLLRNDMARIIVPHSLEVPTLFKIETYPSLHQMVSSVRGQLLPDITIQDIFIALFPCGSITGAPKIRAMEIIHELENRPRGVYCGAIGWIAPNGQMSFNVAIRTLMLEKNGDALLNVGSGVTFDSNSEQEYEECLLKAQFACGTMLP